MLQFGNNLFLDLHQELVQLLYRLSWIDKQCAHDVGTVGLVADAHSTHNCVKLKVTFITAINKGINNRQVHEIDIKLCQTFSKI